MITYTTNQYGLRDKDVDYMQHLFETIPTIEKVVLYGSRAKGDFQKGSDVDLAVIGNDITSNEIAHIHQMLESESLTLLWFDVLHYNNLKSANLKQQIDAYGKTIFSRERINGAA